MAESLLGAVGVAIAAKLETARKANTFGVDDFVTDWDFDGRRGPDDLPDDDLHVTVIVPQGWESITEVDRSGTVEYVGAFDVDVKRKLGIDAQGADSDLDRAEIDRYVALVEAIHEWFSTITDDDDQANRLTISSHSKSAEWVDERSGVGTRSRVAMTYSADFLENFRQFYGMCREVFVIS